MSGIGHLYKISNLLKERYKQDLWNQLSIIPGYDPHLWRKDCFGNTLYYLDYGDRDSKFGWEIDHIFPKMMGGTDDLFNLRAVHWRANASMGGTIGSLFK